MRVKIAQIKDLAEYMKPDTRRLDECNPQINRMEWDGDTLTVMLADAPKSIGHIVVDLRIPDGIEIVKWQ